MDQASEQAGRSNPTQYRPGQSGNPAGRPSAASKRERVEQKTKELAEPFGGLDALDAAERFHIELAAKLFLRPPSKRESATKLVYAAMAALGFVERRRAKMDKAKAKARPSETALRDKLME